MLTVIGDLVDDVLVRPVGPTRRGTDNPTVIVRARGGSAANAAAAAAPLAPTRFIGRVGDDAAGSALVAELASTGVDVRVQRGGRTGTVVVLVDPDDGERTMYPDRAASAQLGEIDPTWLTGTTMLHVPAYGLSAEPAASSIVAAIERVRADGGALSIDLSATTLIEEYGRDRLVELLDRLRPAVVLANAEEAAAIGLDDRVPHPGTLVVVKDGPRPARLIRDDGTTAEVDAVEIGHVPDTTGAGDAFAAGFLTALDGGADDVAACRAAHRAAAALLRADRRGRRNAPGASPQTSDAPSAASRIIDAAPEIWGKGASTDSATVERDYDLFAETGAYDETFDEWGYVGPQTAAAIMRNYVPIGGRVLDAACGSGLTGVALRRAGYEHVDGIDISTGLLALAERTGAYDRLARVDM